MNQKSLAKPLTMALGALGMSLMVPVVSVAFAEMSVPEASVQSTPVALSESQSTSMIDIRTDANQDGLPDELLAETQKLQAFSDAEFAHMQSADSTDEQAVMRAIEAQNIAVEAANIQFAARLPYSDNVKQIMAQSDQARNRLDLYIAERGEDGPEYSALVAELNRLSEQIGQEASYVEVVEAQRKVYDFLGLS